ncbi:putative reverse transcriptase domain-containing protein [Tanacetum coccineum]|uniref:Reverse transcriptase domain-containing protein n=1 Tax=Tanacetum coccineum TaxID=301880 RepID=A0ABQ5CNJ8_9ASTR
MQPRRFKKKSVKRIVEKCVAKAIEEYEKTRTDSNNAGGSGSANTGGTVAPEMHGCSYKTFTNGKPHSFNGTEGVVGLKRWFKKMEQVFEICKCAEDDKVKFAMCTFEGRALTWWNGNVQTLGLSNANQIPGARKSYDGVTSRQKTIASTNGFDVSEAADLHDAIQHGSRIMGTRGSAKLRIEDSIKGYLVGRPGNGKQPSTEHAKPMKEAAHHQPGPCPPRCGTCHKLGHQEGDCRTRIPVARDNSLQNVTCFGCGNHGHYRSDCPELKN